MLRGNDETCFKIPFDNLINYLKFFVLFIICRAVTYTVHTCYGLPLHCLT